MADRRYIPLTLTSNYASSWGVWEGIRELVQNWHDGVYESVDSLNIISSYPLPVHFQKVPSYSQSTTEEFEAYTTDPVSQSNIPLGVLIYDGMNNRLTLINRLTSLKKKILLMGYTAKTEKKEVIGQFGEGLKVGALSLVRDGRPVAMETSVDRWRFELIHNQEFEERVLTVIVSARPEDSSSKDYHNDVFPPCPRDLKQTDTCTTVSNISGEEWKSFLPRFLFLKPPEDCVKTELGTLLLDDVLAGQLYVKGIWVGDLRGEDLAAGVDFTSLQLDRDRNAVPKPSEIDHLVSCIWIKAVNSQPSLLSKYYDLLLEDKYRDVRHAAQYVTDTSLPHVISQMFMSHHGSDAVPVLNNVSMEKLQEIRRELSSKVVLCNETLLKILNQSGRLISVEDALLNLHSREFTRVPFSGLDKFQQDVLRHATKLVQMAEPSFSLNSIDVVKTKDYEKCVVVGDRIDLPFWMLQRDAVHEVARFCEQNSQCKCREARISNAILELRKEYLTKNRPSADFQGMGDPSNLDHTMQCLVSRLAMERCHEIEPTYYCVDLHSCAVIGYDLMSNQQLVKEFSEREAGYIKKIQELEKSLEMPLIQKSSELTELKLKLEAVEKEAVKKEISLVDAEQSIRRHCDSQIEKAKAETKKAYEAYRNEVALKENRNVELQSDLKYKDEQLIKLKDQIKRDKDATTRREEQLVEELQHYVDKLKNRTEQLLTICGDGRANNDETMRGKFKKLANVCDMVVQDLQSVRFVCAVCKTKRKNSMFQPCGHFIYCKGCAHAVLAEKRRCPICNCNATGVQEVFE